MGLSYSVPYGYFLRLTRTKGVITSFLLSHDLTVGVAKKNTLFYSTYTERRSAYETAIEFALFIILIALSTLINPNA